MKKSLLVASGILACALVFASLFYTPTPQVIPQAEFSQVGLVKDEIRQADPAPDSISEKLSSMTLDEKIGQMMIIGFVNPYLDSHIKEMIGTYHVGGVNLLERNVTGKAQIIKLDADLKAYNASTTDIPFMIATDQEGGSYSRFKFLSYLDPETKLPTVEGAYAEARGRGEELAKLGVTVNFAPVTDYVTDKKSYLYSRTFGTTTSATVPLAKAMLEGYEDAGIRGTVKHFPGYGNISKDPHRNAAGFDDTDYYLKSLEPFKALLENKTDGAVMTAHVVIPSADKKPATLSAYFLKDILRKQWNYQGVIITDDLEMVSAGKKSVPDLAVEAIQAGNDMIISTYTTALHAQIHQAIKKAVLEGKISIDDIDKSVERILRFKKYGGF